MENKAVVVKEHPTNPPNPHNQQKVFENEAIQKLKNVKKTKIRK